MIFNGREIKAIIFDLGGVLLNIDYNLCVEAFRKIGLKDFSELYSKKKQHDLFDRFEEGKISAGDFRDELRKALLPSITDAQIDAAWNSMLLDFPPERLNLLESLQSKYRLFLLSNTNEIHIKEVAEILKKSFGMPDLSYAFEKEYFSHQIKMRKPNLEIFEFVINENSLAAEKTLFIDDSIQHVRGAEIAGINALHLEKEKTILDLF